MVWFNVDDGLSTSPKVLSIPRAERMAAVGLWTFAGSWCAKHLTDGVVPEFMLDEWGASTVLADALVDAGLWERSASRFVFHNWDEYQRSRSEVEEKREAERERKRAYREKRAGQSGDASSSGPASVPAGVPMGQDAGQPRVSLQASGHPYQAIPSHSIPSQAKPIRDKEPSSPRGDGAFAEFYMAYPRKVGKEAARKKFITLVRKIDAQLIIDGARKFAADPNLPEKQFIPHPATWLNAGRWDDEPLPMRDGAPRPLPDIEPGNEWMTR